MHYIKLDSLSVTFLSSWPGGDDMDGVSFNNSMEDSLGSPSVGHASSSNTASSGEKTRRTKVKSNQQVHMHVHVHKCGSACNYFGIEFTFLVWQEVFVCT